MIQQDFEAMQEREAIIEAERYSSGFTKRPYQERAQRKVFEQWQDCNRTLLVLPTGSGKTQIAYWVIDRFLQDNPDKRVLFVAHREELINQSANRCEQMLGIRPAVEMAESRADEGYKQPKQVVVASIQTLNSGKVCRHCGGHGRKADCTYCLDGRRRRVQKFDPKDFGMVVLDECHHAVNVSTMRMIDYFADNSEMKFLGITATPDRNDEVALGIVFETVADEYALPDAISDGWLVPLNQQFVFVEGLNLSRAKNNKYGDLQDKDVAEAMDLLKRESGLHKIVDPTYQLSGGRPTVVYAASVQNAEDMAEIFNRHEQGCAYCIHAKTPRDERRDLLRRFGNGEFRFLTNVGIFTEGWDEQTVGCIAVARPTKSRALYSQMIGRSFRTLPGVIEGLDTPELRKQAIARSGKPAALILDFVGNSGQHKLVSSADILGGREPDQIIERAVDNAKKKSQKGEMTDMQLELIEARNQLEREAIDRRKAVVGTTRFRTKVVDPFDLFDVLPQREPGWFKGKRPTEKMRQTLIKSFKVPAKQVDKLSYWQAHNMLDVFIARIKANKCTFDQAKVLARFGEDVDVSFTEASKIIDEIANNGWRPRR